MFWFLCKFAEAYEISCWRGVTSFVFAWEWIMNAGKEISEIWCRSGYLGKVVDVTNAGVETREKS